MAAFVYQDINKNELAFDLRGELGEMNRWVITQFCLGDHLSVNRQLTGRSWTLERCERLILSTTLSLQTIDRER